MFNTLRLAVISAICFFAAAVCRPGTLVAQDKDQGATVQKFLDALAERRQAVKSARFELSGRMIYTAQSRQNQQARGQYYPVRDETGELHELTVLDFEGNRFRQDYQGPEMFIGRTGVGAVDVIRRIHTFDGIEMYTLHPRTKHNERLYRDSPPGHWEGDKWDVEKADKEMPASVFFFVTYPMLFSCGRLPDPTTNFRIDARPEYSATDFRYRGVVLTGGVQCALFRWVRPPVTSSYYEWYADAHDLARIVRCQRVSDGRITYDLEIQYKPGSRVPSNWVVRNYDNDNPRRANKLVREGQYKVDAAEINQAVTDSEFSPDFKPGMLISTKDGVLPVASDGKSLVLPISQWRLWRYVLIGVVVAACVILVLLGRGMLRRRRRGRGSLPIPE